jgi:hypothetical protein
MVPNHVLYQAELLPDHGALERIRTPNLLIRSQMLYPIELRAHLLRATNFILTTQFIVVNSFLF